MPDLNVDIGIDINIAAQMQSAVNSQVLPLLSQAVRAVSQQTALNWQQQVHSAKLWSGEKDEYAQSITWQMSGPFSAMVETKYKHAQEIESGRPPRDLKKMLNTSLKVRRTESGKRFLVIPMRHNTPGNNAHAEAMPQGVHDLVKALTSSTILGQGQRPSGQVTHLSPGSGMSASANQSPYLSNTSTQGAMMVRKNNYQWGQRLTTSMLKEAGLNPGQHRNLVGTYRFDTSTPGGGASSAYLSFRVMIEGSTGWIVPAQPGQNIAHKVSQSMQPKAEKAFREAVLRSF